MSAAEISAQDIADVERGIDAWRASLPFSAYDHDDLLGAALEHLTICSQMPVDHWRAIFWGRLRWRLLDEIRRNPRCAVRRAYRVVSLVSSDFPASGDDFAEVEVDDIIDRLPTRDARVVHALIDGRTLREISKIEHVSEASVCLWRQRIAREMIAA